VTKTIRNARGCFIAADKAIEAGIRRVLVHDLRRTAARKLRRAGVPDKIIMGVVGWKTRAMLDRYDIVTAADLDVFRGRMEAAEAERLTTIQQQSPDSTAEREIGKAFKLLN
jgi:hypothetical protein